jgi:hypothetical protein
VLRAVEIGDTPNGAVSRRVRLALDQDAGPAAWAGFCWKTEFCNSVSSVILHGLHAGVYIVGRDKRDTHDIDDMGWGEIILWGVLISA